MPGLISSMFPEWQSTVDTYKPAFNALRRGLETTPTSLVDLAALPFTLTGKIEPQDVVGSTAWADRKGLLTPMESAKPDSKTPVQDELALRSLEMMSPLALPAKLGGLLGKGASSIMAAGKAAPAAQPVIPLIAGQAENDVVKMSQAAKLANEKQYAQKIADFQRNQQDSAAKVIDGFRNAVGKGDTKGEIGERIQRNFESYYDSIKKSNKLQNDANFAEVTAHPGAAKPLPLSQTGNDRIANFLQENLLPNSPESYKVALTDLQARASNVLDNPNLTVKEMQQYLKEANESFSKSVAKPGPYDTVHSGDLSRVQTVYKKALQDRLDEAMIKGDPEVAEAAEKLTKANAVFAASVETENHIQKQSIHKFLGAKEDESLNPEAIVNYFKKLSPTQQTFFSGVAAKVDPDMVSVMRRHVFEDLFNKGVNKGYSAGESSFDMGKFLTQVDNLRTENPHMIDFVLGNDPKLRQQFEGAVENMRAATNRGPNVADDGGTLAGIGAGIVGATTNSHTAAKAAGNAFGKIEGFLTDKQGLYTHLFEGGPPPSGKLGVAMSKGAAVTAGPATAAMQQYNNASMPSEQAPQQAPTAPTGRSEAVDPSYLDWELEKPQQAPAAPARPAGGEVEDKYLQW